MAAQSCRRRRCLFCNELFHADPRNRRRQRYCCEADCRRASKQASQARWLSKPGNANYFRGAANTERNRAWRRANPGYWKRSRGSGTQQDLSSAQQTHHQEDTAKQAALAQQDPLTLQLPVVVGLIAKLTDSTQQETIDGSVRRLHALGQQVMAQSPATGSLLLSGLRRTAEALPGRPHRRAAPRNPNPTPLL
jgi:hypothetical protein